MVDELISENKRLKRALAQAESAAGTSSGLGQATRTLSGLQRRLSRALSESPGARRQEAPRPRRKVTDPEVLRRRQEALAKARAVRAAKRQAAAQG
jgi:hypothetical protein